MQASVQGLVEPTLFHVTVRAVRASSCPQLRDSQPSVDVLRYQNLPRGSDPRTLLAPKGRRTSSGISIYHGFVLPKGVPPHYETFDAYSLPPPVPSQGKKNRRSQAQNGNLSLGPINPSRYRMIGRGAARQDGRECATIAPQALS
ncbi:hypothetical protein VFPFJ_07397 [Purpureocillium lilacinum]|uniref:Uncharacterized protein n=1 Tax=Purpureocillium lilacinum TaxID=33203 RepID=A0A179HG47_PURLI|nr:hypothetical protein VFPFJ_07397 [Purpureocillium lilacinum]OAQ88932.1 hypothetical protein VFPFJ_07397 [Purpureocillium lilacinum]